MLVPVAVLPNPTILPPLVVEVLIQASTLNQAGPARRVPLPAVAVELPGKVALEPRTPGVPRWPPVVEGSRLRPVKSAASVPDA